jgi:hypothetical protein
LRNITDPQPKEPPQTARTFVPGLADRLKYRWNTELEAAVRNIQHFNWEQWRRDAEDKVSSVFSKGLGTAVDEAEKKINWTMILERENYERAVCELRGVETNARRNEHTI